MSTWGGQVESMSHMSWVWTAASLRTDASTTDNSRFSAAATTTKYDCGNVALLLPDLFNSSREARNLDIRPQPSDFSIVENTNTFLKWAGH